MTAPWLTPPTGAAEARRAALAAQVPVLVTERLVLDAPRIEDAAAYERMVSDYAPAETPEEIWLDFNQMAAGWLLRGHGLYAARERATGDLVALMPMGHERGDPEPELGWFVLPEHRRRGYAAEAARALLGAYADLGIAPVAYIDPSNAPSRAVAASIGLAPDAAPEQGAEVWRAPPTSLAQYPGGGAQRRGRSPSQGSHPSQGPRTSQGSHPLAPTIRTERLTLRPLRMSDLPAWTDFLTSPRARFMQEGIDADTAWSWFTHDAASWSLMGHGGLMIEAGGETVGEVAVIHPPHFPERELGWLLYEGHEGRGYATEAAAALRDHLTAAGVIDRALVSYVHRDNAASAAVARRLGARIDPEAECHDPDSVVYRHPFREQE